MMMDLQYGVRFLVSSRYYIRVDHVPIEPYDPVRSNIDFTQNAGRF